jgi:hypothetical protein
MSIVPQPLVYWFIQGWRDASRLDILLRDQPLNYHLEKMKETKAIRKPWVCRSLRVVWKLYSIYRQPDSDFCHFSAWSYVSTFQTVPVKLKNVISDLVIHTIMYLYNRWVGIRWSIKELTLWTLTLLLESARIP